MCLRVSLHREYAEAPAARAAAARSHIWAEANACAASACAHTMAPERGTSRVLCACTAHREDTISRRATSPVMAGATVFCPRWRCYRYYVARPACYRHARGIPHPRVPPPPPPLHMQELEYTTTDVAAQITKRGWCTGQACMSDAPQRASAQCAHAPPQPRPY
jgi:hypothetical protein